MKRGDLLEWLRRLAQAMGARCGKALGPALGFLAVYALFCFLSPRTFMTAGNLETVARQSAMVAIGAVGMTLVIISAGIDLSIGSTMALSCVVTAYALRAGASPALATALGVGSGLACGLINGLLIVGLRVVPFIVTLGSMLVVRGVANGLASEQTVAPDRRGWLDVLIAPAAGAGPLDAMVGVMVGVMAAALVGLLATDIMVRLQRTDDDDVPVRLAGVPAARIRGGLVAAILLAAAVATVRTFPPGVWLMLVLALATAAMLRNTRLGRHIFAVGSSEATARLCGVAVGRVKVLVYSFCGACAGLAGVLLFSRMRVGDPTTAQARELDVIAAVVIGGGSLAGGEGSVAGSVIGALILTTIDVGLQHLDMPKWWRMIITGGIIIGAVALDRLRHRRES